MTSPNFTKMNGLVPCIVQDSVTSKVLMVGFMSVEAWEKTCHEKQVTFFSRTKGCLWTKGETSGNFLRVNEILLDCDNDSILIKATPQGPVCHSGADTCFNERNTGPLTLDWLEEIVHLRKKNPVQGSYTTNLLQAGINKVAQKVGEEAVELVIEAKDNDNEKFVNEAADLIYHFLVLLAAKDIPLAEVLKTLGRRMA